MSDDEKQINNHQKDSIANSRSGWRELIALYKIRQIVTNFYLRQKYSCHENCNEPQIIKYVMYFVNIL